MPVSENIDPPNTDTVDRLRSAFNALGAEIEALPPSRRRAVALTNLETAGMWAVKAATIGDG